MKPIILSLAATILLSSCTNIIFNNKLDGPAGLDFSTGKWLVNEIEYVPSEISDNKHTDILLDGLTRIGGESIKYIGSDRNVGKLSGQIPFLTDTAMFKTIRGISDFNYLINVRASTFRKESGGLAIGEQDPENQAIVEILNIDIRQDMKIFYKEITAIETWPMNDEMEETPSKFSFTRSSKNLISNALKRGIKDLQKESTTIN